MTVDGWSRQLGVITSGSLLWHRVHIMYSTFYIWILLKDSEGNAQVLSKQIQFYASWLVLFGNLVLESQYGNTATNHWLIDSRKKKAKKNNTKAFSPSMRKNTHTSKGVQEVIISQWNFCYFEKPRNFQMFEGLARLSVRLPKLVIPFVDVQQILPILGETKGAWVKWIYTRVKVDGTVTVHWFI